MHRRDVLLMSACASCDDIGVVPFVPFDGPADADVTANDLHFGICLCDAGMDLRWDRNEKARTVPRWQVWAAREQIQASRVCLVEEAFTAPELIAAGLVAERRTEDRSAALLAAGRRKR
jgi:hypothetical protein